MRACIPRFLFSLDAHMRLRYNSNYTGEFLRGFSCTAFASIRGYKPAVPFFPPFPPPKYAERVISNKLAVLYAKRLVNVRISCMIISFETRTTSLYLCLLDYLENSVKNSRVYSRSWNSYDSFLSFNPYFSNFLSPLEFSYRLSLHLFLNHLLRSCSSSKSSNNRLWISRSRSFPVSESFYFIIITKFFTK